MHMDASTLFDKFLGSPGWTRHVLSTGDPVVEETKLPPAKTLRLTVSEWVL